MVRGFRRSSTIVLRAVVAQNETADEHRSMDADHADGLDLSWIHWFSSVFLTREILSASLIQESHHSEFKACE